MSEKPTRPYEATPAGENARAFAERLRRFTREPAGPLEVMVMCLGRELHDRERPGEDWFSLAAGTMSCFGPEGGTVADYCARACENRGISWLWVASEIGVERVSPLVIRW